MFATKWDYTGFRPDLLEGLEGMKVMDALRAHVLDARRRDAGEATPDAEAAAWVRAQAWWW